MIKELTDEEGWGVNFRLAKSTHELFITDKSLKNQLKSEGIKSFDERNFIRRDRKMKKKTTKNKKNDTITIKDGKFDGLYLTWYENGQKKNEGNYNNGEKVGKWTYWFDSGKKEKEETYKNGKNDGKVTSWFDSGKKEKEETYKNGNPDGLYLTWYENGQKKNEGNYNNYKYVGKWTSWFENGQKEKEETFKDRKKGFYTTKWDEWYDNGKKKSKGNWKAGNLDGLHTNWYENGQKKNEGNYNNGEKVGKWNYWFDSGKKEKEETYKAGEKISEYFFVCDDIIELLKDRGTKMTASDIDAHLKHQNVDQIKWACEKMYHDGKISRTSNYRYFVLTKKKPKPTQSKQVDIGKELKKYKGLLDQELITQDDYDAKKKELLGL
jgi:antitoxin component YwqK of YwqJK toxin-antitoxin module